MLDFSNPSTRHEIAIGVANRLNIMRILQAHPNTSADEIAARLGISYATVQAHILKGRLRRFDHREGVRGPTPVTTFIEMNS